jgi:hypothetical protein
MRRKKAVGTTIRNFSRLFHRSNRGVALSLPPARVNPFPQTTSIAAQEATRTRRIVGGEDEGKIPGWANEICGGGDLQTD